MGTSNRLAQFGGRNFIELLEVDRPERLARHDFAASPPFFSFGDHNRLAMREREGLSMLVFASDDARADIASSPPPVSPTFAPFDFERHAKLPDGTQGYRCVLTCLRAIPGDAERCFLRLPRTGLRTISGSRNTNRTLTVPLELWPSISPHQLQSAMRHSSARCSVEKLVQSSGGCSVACGPSQELRVLTPQAIAERDSSVGVSEDGTPILAGIALATHSRRRLTSAAEANGMFIEWVPV